MTSYYLFLDLYKWDFNKSLNTPLNYFVDFPSTGEVVLEADLFILGQENKASSWHLLMSWFNVFRPKNKRTASVLGKNFDPSKPGALTLENLRILYKQLIRQHDACKKKYSF